jgi:hypothetical protein
MAASSGQDTPSGKLLLVAFLEQTVWAGREQPTRHLAGRTAAVGAKCTKNAYKRHHNFLVTVGA